MKIPDKKVDYLLISFFCLKRCLKYLGIQPFSYFCDMISFPNAKINLGLHVTEKRSDGFHNLETVFFPVGWCDALEFTEADKLTFTSSGIAISGDPESNLVMKAYRLLGKDYKLPALNIHLHKQIPFGAGLGGGSSDAAFMLTMLNKRYNLNISEAKLVDYAAALGSDCPFFILNKPVYAKGRGELMNIIDLRLNGWWLLIVKPALEVSTADAFKFVVPQKSEFTLTDLISRPVPEWKNKVKNQFESSVFEQFNGIENIRETMYNLGAEYASMSGSGSCVFGLFSKPLYNFQNHFPTDCLTFSQHL
jgi:4-diphosphocytidyl-2-C-methyl-D-erythritol kinase